MGEEFRCKMGKGVTWVGRNTDGKAQTSLKKVQRGSHPTADLGEEGCFGTGEKGVRTVWRMRAGKRFTPSREKTHSLHNTGPKRLKELK